MLEKRAHACDIHGAFLGFLAALLRLFRGPLGAVDEMEKVQRPETVCSTSCTSICSLKMEISRVFSKKNKNPVMSK